MNMVAIVLIALVAGLITSIGLTALGAPFWVIIFCCAAVGWVIGSALC